MWRQGNPVTTPTIDLQFRPHDTGQKVYGYAGKLNAGMHSRINSFFNSRAVLVIQPERTITIRGLETRQMYTRDIKNADFFVNCKLCWPFPVLFLGSSA